MPRRKPRASLEITRQRRRNCQNKMRQYHRRIAMARERLGGKCAECGATEELEFDHVDPLRKRHDINAIWSYSLQMFLDEVDKCTLLCRSTTP